MDKDISVKCRVCGRSAKSKEFVLDADFGKVVCPLCIKEKRDKKEVYKELAKEKKEKRDKESTGWDIEDEYLEKANKEKLKVKVQRVDEEKVKYKCPKCNYNFLYNTVKKIPGRCPYCSSNIYKLIF